MGLATHGGPDRFESLTSERAQVKVMSTGNDAEGGEDEVEVGAEMAMNQSEYADAPPAPHGRLLILSDVYLLTAESGGSVAVPGLTLVMDASGLTVRKPDGAVGAALGWDEVSGLVADKRMRTPAGHPGVVLEAVTAVKTHRFVVPSDNPAGLEYEVAQLAGALAAGPPPPPPVTKERAARRSRLRFWRSSR